MGLPPAGADTTDRFRDLSIVIPALNAAPCLNATLATLDVGAEVIVVDGGSSDRTVSITRAAGARVLLAPRGRGSQIGAGVAAARNHWLLLLHADTKLQPGWRDAVAEHMAGGSGRAGYFRFVLNSSDRRARRLERVVTWRSRVLGLPYGDQGLLIHRDLLRELGGIAPIPLMEDVDLIRRIGRNRLVALPADALTSAVRWERDGYLRRSARNLLCLSLWFAGVPPRLLLHLYR
jgi:rSAM/selenodomain-associated transferase 2